MWESGTHGSRCGEPRWTPQTAHLYVPRSSHPVRATIVARVRLEIARPPLAGEPRRLRDPERRHESSRAHARELANRSNDGEHPCG